MRTGLFFAISILWSLAAATANATPQLLNLTHNGEAQPDYHTRFHAMSDNGRVIAMTTRARNMHPDDDSNNVKMVIRDLDNGGTNSPLELVPVSIGNKVRFSERGRFIAYRGRDGLVVLDRETRQLDILAGPANQIGAADMTPDARYVLFQAGLNPEFPNDPNGIMLDAYVYDRETRTQERVLGDDPSSSAPLQISDDGRFVLLHHRTRDELLRYDRITGAIEEASPGNDRNFAQMSGDGRLVVFSSPARLEPSRDTNNHRDIYLHDIERRSTSVLTPGSNLTVGFGPQISSDGRFVTFRSAASNFVNNDRNGAIDGFVLDRNSGEFTNLSILADNYSNGVFINSDGSTIVLESAATNLVVNDFNRMIDLFGFFNGTPEEPPEPVPCEGAMPAGVLVSSTGARIEVAGSDGCLGPDFFDFGPVVGAGLQLPAEGHFSRQSFYPGNYVDLPRDRLAFYRYELPSGYYLFKTTFVDPQSGSEVNMGFHSRSLQPQSFELLELLITRQLQQRLTPIYQEVGTTWTFETDTDDLVDLGGKVYTDVSGDGRRDNGEAGLQGAFVTLFACGDRDGRIGGMSTDSIGDWRFGSLDAGQYQLVVSLPSGRKFAPQQFDDQGNLVSVIRQVTLNDFNDVQVGYSDCVDYQSDRPQLDIGVLP